MARWLRRSGTVGVALLAVAVLPAAPSGGTGSARAALREARPIPVIHAELRQDGRDLVWRVTLGSRFSAAGLRQNRRELCLVLERAASAAISGVVCAAPGRSGRGTRLIYSRVTTAGRGPGHVVPARLSRSSASELTASFLPADVGLRYAPLRWQVLSGLRQVGCAAGPPGECSLFYPGRPQLLEVHVPRLVGCVAGGPSYVTNGSRSRRVVALSFDDGPWYDTPRFLDVLEHEHVPATFFQIGRQVASLGPPVDNRMLADGDIIGDHTWDHRDVAAGGPTATWEITSTRSAIVHLTGFTPCLFRAPYGAVSSALIGDARGLGFNTVEWDVDPRDWSRPGAGAIVSTVLSQVRNGSIIVQHDGGGDRSQTLAALPAEIHALRRRGYGFVTVPQLLGLQVIYK